MTFASRPARLLLGAVLCPLACIAGGCSPRTADAHTSPTAEASPPKEGVVEIAEASRAYVTVAPIGDAGGRGAIRAPARVEFRDGGLARIGAPREGRVVKVLVQTGQAVAAGQPLVVLDCPEAATIRSAAETTAAQLREARVAAERERRMLDQGIGIEREKLAADTHVLELEAASAQARAAEAFVGPGSGTTVTVRAPSAGTVVARAATEGMAVAPGGEPLVEIGDPAALWIAADVFERDLPQVKAGATVQVELPALQQTMTGRVESIGATVSSGLRTAPVHVVVQGSVARLRPGMYGRAEIAASVEPGSTITLPTEAVLIKGRESVVYVEAGHLTFQRRTVTVSPPVDGHVTVLSGLSPGDHVVVKGALLLDGVADQLL